MQQITFKCPFMGRRLSAEFHYCTVVSNRTGVTVAPTILACALPLRNIICPLGKQGPNSLVELQPRFRISRLVLFIADLVEYVCGRSGRAVDKATEISEPAPTKCSYKIAGPRI